MRVCVCLCVFARALTSWPVFVLAVPVLVQSNELLFFLHSIMLKAKSNTQHNIKCTLTTNGDETGA